MKKKARWLVLVVVVFGIGRLAASSVADGFAFGPVEGWPVKLAFKADQYTTVRTENGRRIARVDVPEGKRGWLGLIAKYPGDKLRGRVTTFYIRGRNAQPEPVPGGGYLKFITSYKRTDGIVKYPGMNGKFSPRWTLMSFRVDGTKDHDAESAAGEATFFIGIEGGHGKVEFDLDSFRVNEPEPEPEGLNEPVGTLVTLPGGAERMEVGAEAKEIPLPESKGGRVWLLVETLSSHEAPGKTVYGGYDLYLPKIAYRFRLDGRELKPEISARAPVRMPRDAKGNVPYKGYLVFPNPVEIGAGAKLSVTCDGGGWVGRIYLLSADEFALEELRAGDMFKVLTDDSGVGYNAWAFTVKTARFDYPMVSLKKAVCAVEKLGLASKRVAGLHERAKRFLESGDAGTAEWKREGIEVAAEWRRVHAAFRASLAKKLLPKVAALRAEADTLRKGLEAECHGGRFAAFWLDNALVYAEEVIKETKPPASSEKTGATKPEASSPCYDFSEHTHIMSSFWLAEEAMRKARGYAALPQRKVEFPQFAAEVRSDLLVASPGCRTASRIPGCWAA